MRRLYADGHRVELISPFDLADEDWVAVVSNMGAPLVGQERLADSRNIARAVEIQQELLGQKFRAVMSLEIGGGNGIQPLMAAAHLGLPVVDADTMGRAYPEAQMTSVAVGGLRPYPCVLYDPRGIEAVVTKVPNWKWMERASRKICVEMGSIASTCKAPRTGAEVKEWGIHFTVSKAIGIGRRVRAAQRRHEDPVAAVLDEAHGQAVVPRQGRRCRAAHDRGFSARPGGDRGARRGPRRAARNRLSERMGRGLARRRADRDVARSDLRARHRVGRSLRHRDDPLRKAGDGRGLAGPAGVPDAQRASTMSARAPSATTSTSARCSMSLSLPRRRGRPSAPTRDRESMSAGDQYRCGVCSPSGEVVHAVKTPTTEDVTTGIVTALASFRPIPRSRAERSTAVVIGTTHFVNAVVQRRGLARVAAVRIGLPAAASLPPFCDWPPDLADLVRGEVFMLEGGHDYDGRPIVPFDEDGMRRAARQIRDSGIRSVAIAAIFSPLDPSHEERARRNPAPRNARKRRSPCRAISAASACSSARTRPC